MTDMHLTVVVATCNRSSCLERLLDGFAECAVPDGLKWEVLVVDNNSTDNTPQVIEAAVAKYPFVRATPEPQQGVSYARNRGAVEAFGRYVFFIDDDAAPSRTFLTGIEKGLADYPDILCFGTKVISHFPDRPKWFAIEGPYALMGILGMYDLGTEDKLLEQGDPLPIGSGILIDKDLFCRYGMFDTTLGVKAQSKYPGRGEDTCYMEKLVQENVAICYLAYAQVDHYPDLSRYNMARLRRMYIGSGISLAHQYGANAKRIFGVPRFLIRNLAEYSLLVALNYLKNSGEARVYFKTRYWFTFGMILNYLGLHEETD